MCNLYSITTNQEAVIRLFRVINRYVGNLAPMPGVFPDYPAPVIRNVPRAGDQEIWSLLRCLWTVAVSRESRDGLDARTISIDVE